jgi:general secretion pathway protein B
MSFILDALKKSEIERQRQSVPGLMDTGPAPRRTRFPIWAIALTALLAVNLAVLIIVLARGGMPGLFGHSAQEDRSSSAGASAASTTPPPLPAPSAQLAAPTASPTAPPAGTAPPANNAQPADSRPPEHPFSPMDPPAPVYAPEIPAESAPTGGAITAAPVQASRPSLRDSASGGRAREPLLTSGGDKTDQEVLPTISELDLTGANALPDMHLDVHVYATKAAERFVYINMRKYREGDTLAEGPTLERIRRDGVVLDYHGLRFVLPRQ